MSTRNRLELALERLTFENGFGFERFAIAFLSSEFPDLRPVGGMHDGGRDAFLHRPDAQPDVFLQCSVTGAWTKKIRDTVGALRQNGHSPRELIYCSPQDIQGEADSLKAELRRDGVSLDVRDRGYFVSRAENSVAARSAAESLARQVVDPLLASREVLASASLGLSTEEEKIAVTYLQLELEHRNPTKGLSKLCFEALVTYALRDASPESPRVRTEIHAAVRALVRHADESHVREQIDGTLQRLVRRGLVKHHTKADAFTLSHEHRSKMRERLEQLLLQESQLFGTARKLIVEIAGELAIDYPFSADSVARDALRILDELVCDSGRLSAVALVGQNLFGAPRRSADRVLEEMFRDRRSDFASLRELSEDQARDLIPLAVERLCASADTAVTHRLGVLADAYCLRFLLKQTTEVQDAIAKIVSGVTLLLDTSVLIRAMSEHAVPRSVQRLPNLLRAAHSMGCRLVASPDVLNELETHLERIRYNHEIHRAPSSFVVPQQHFEIPLLERSWMEARKSNQFTGSLTDFIEQFMGRDSPQEDLIEYLNAEFGVEYSELADEFSGIPVDEIGSLFVEWKEKKRRRPWVDEQSFETLVMHDVRAFLLVERQRKATVADGVYGHRWWWLAIDSSALYFDRIRSGWA